MVGLTEVSVDYDRAVSEWMHARQNAQNQHLQTMNVVFTCLTVRWNHDELSVKRLYKRTEVLI